MIPVSPVYPGFSEPYEFTMAKDQLEYSPIPVIAMGGTEERIVSRWEFSDEERKLISEGGSLLFDQLTFGSPYQPVAFRVVPVTFRVVSKEYRAIEPRFTEETK